MQELGQNAKIALGSREAIGLSMLLMAGNYLV
jgi:hypothetical protein